MSKPGADQPQPPGASVRTVVVATHNPGKLKEIEEITGGNEFRFAAASELPGVPDIEETGETFEENAIKKATLVARATLCITLADDSGLCVDALGGRPGVYSARFAGPGARDEDNTRKLLMLMRDVPWEKRTCRFVCVVAVALPSGQVEIARGVCEGFIAFDERGCFGFGYDPVFYVPQYGKTFAELGPEVKNRISHRAVALRAALPILRRLAASDLQRGPGKGVPESNI